MNKQEGKHGAARGFLELALPALALLAAVGLFSAVIVAFVFIGVHVHNENETREAAWVTYKAAVARVVPHPGIEVEALSGKMGDCVFAYDSGLAVGSDVNDRARALVRACLAEQVDKPRLGDMATRVYDAIASGPER